MKCRHQLLIIAVFACAWLGCSPTKGLKENEKLYTGARINIDGGGMNARQKKVMRADLAGLARPKPNTRFLGLRLKLGIYNMFRNAKPNSFFGKLRDRNGEPPVLLSDVDLKYNDKLLQNYLENKGWFQAKVGGDTVVKNKTAFARYTAIPGNQYTIRNVIFPEDSSDLSMAIREISNKTLLKENSPFDLDVIKAERLRIDAALKEKGFYFFSPENLLIKTDSTIGSNKVDMQMVIKPETPQDAATIYKINKVYIYSGFSLNTARIDTMLTHAETTEGFTIIDRRNRYKPRLFTESMQFTPGEVYNRADHNQTLNRLISLNLFKFVKNRFEVAAVDSPYLDAYYYLTPLPGKSLRAEFTAIGRSNNTTGSQVSLSLFNRNLFRNGSQFSVSAYIGSDVQSSGTWKGYNTFRTGAEATFAVPRFWIPIFDVHPKGPFAPRTNLKLGYDILQRQNLYTLNSYRFEYGYTWKKNIQKSHELFPVSISYVQPLNVTPEYDSMKKETPGLDRATEQQFILGSRYEYLFNQLADNVSRANAFYFNGIVDLSGNIAGLLTGANTKKGKTVLIRDVPFSQYVKLEADGRYYRRLGLKSSWANRIDIGFGLPYGNSTQVPYIKQFFSGGNNSLRGFRSRSVGPGTYTYVDSTNIIPDQTGDLKLELNTEFRPHISGPLYGAIFIDAGNIWLWNDSTYTSKPGSQFSGKFLNQLAMDAGIGLRLDIVIFVIRLDVAVPLRRPWEQNPWVMQQIKWTPEWRRENIVYNLAIGYPF